MKLHREGRIIIPVSTLIIGGILTALWFLVGQWHFIFWPLFAAGAVFYILILRFFRVPDRTTTPVDNTVLCPCDGKVVVIEEVEETEYFKDKRIQVSIFMSPLNVHMQWYPMNGRVAYSKYHPGLYLVAWHPKSSTENERTTVVIEQSATRKVLFRQVAGAVARRIVNYAKENKEAVQGKECGFIKFGSRVDVYLPLDAQIDVEIGQVVAGVTTQLATLK